MNSYLKVMTRLLTATCLAAVSFAALAGGQGVPGERLATIDFDTVPEGTKFVGGAIDLVGNVNVHQALSVGEIHFPDGSVQKAAASDLVAGAGDPRENGERLLAFLAAVEEAPERPYLVRLGPGEFDLGGGSLVLQDGVSLEGCGRSLTRIVADGGSTNARATLKLAAASLSRVTVESRGASYENAVAVYVDSADAVLDDVTALARGASNLNYGIRLVEANVRLHDVSALAEGGSIAYAVAVNSAPEAILRDVRAMASGGEENYAVFVINGNDAPGLQATLERVSAEAWGGTTSHGLRLVGLTDVRVTGSTFLASQALMNFGISTQGLAPLSFQVARSTVQASGTESYGLYVSNTGGVKTAIEDLGLKIDHSIVSGETSAVFVDVGLPIFVGASRLRGGVIQTVSAQIRCAGVYDGQYKLLDDLCTAPE